MVVSVRVANLTVKAIRSCLVNAAHVAGADSMDDLGSCCLIEVTGLKYVVTERDLQHFLTPKLPGLISISCPPRSGKASIEMASVAQAEAAVRVIGSVRDPALCFSPPGQSRSLKAVMAGGGTSFSQGEEAQRWPYLDRTAMPEDQQDASNNADLQKLFSRLPHGAMRESLEAAVTTKLAEGLVLKELHLAEGRRCELVFAGCRGQKDTLVLRAEASTLVENEHLQQFRPLFDDLPAEARRTGIDATLHRISRSVHSIAKRMTAVTARVGRIIQGTVLPMLIDGSTTDSHGQLEALAQACTRGLLIIGPPNVGKTTLLRELSRLLSEGDSRICVIVDKSMEICGTGVVPHPAIGHARVLTVEKPELQDRVMIEAVENQSPDLVIVDELTNKEQCNAARTITGRGVAVIATVHGDGLASLLNDPDRSLLLGGIGSVTLSAGEAAARPDKARQVQKRLGASVFGASPCLTHRALLPCLPAIEMCAFCPLTAVAVCVCVCLCVCVLRSRCGARASRIPRYDPTRGPGECHRQVPRPPTLFRVLASP